MGAAARLPLVTAQRGAHGADNGIVLFVFPSVRTVRLDVGYGLEGAIPDIEAKRLVETTLLPKFAAGRYEDGFEDFLSALVKRLQEHADEAVKADKPIGIVAFAMGIVRQVPRLATLARDAFQAADVKGRLVLGDILGGVMAVAGIIVGIAFLGLGSQAVMEGHGTFSGGGITAVWSPS